METWHGGCDPLERCFLCFVLFFTMVCFQWERVQCIITGAKWMAAGGGGSYLCLRPSRREGRQRGTRVRTLLALADGVACLTQLLTRSGRTGGLVRTLCDQITSREEKFLGVNECISCPVICFTHFFRKPALILASFTCLLGYLVHMMPCCISF